MDLKSRFNKIFEFHRDHYDYMEIRIESSEETMISMKKSQLEDLTTTIELGGNIRVLKDGGWAFVVFNDLDRIEDLATEAVKKANILGKSKSVLAPVNSIQDEVYFNPPNDPRKINLGDKINLLKKYCQIIDNYGEPIVMSQVWYTEKFFSITFANSEGTFIIQEKWDMRGNIFAIASKNGITEYDTVMFGSVNDFEILYDREAEMKKICEIATALLDAPETQRWFIYYCFGSKYDRAFYS